MIEMGYVICLRSQSKDKNPDGVLLTIVLLTTKVSALFPYLLNKDKNCSLSVPVSCR